MKYYICFFAVLTIIFVISCSNEDSVVEDEGGPLPSELSGDTLMAYQLDQIAHPISGSHYLLSDDELSSLSVLGNHQFVGLGEATHGTREFFEMKHRIFKYLVEHHGFRVFAIEADMGESYYINEYIQTGQGNAGDIMRDKMFFWTWATREVQDFIEWMKNYNASQLTENKLYYIGVDCQYFKHSTNLVSDYLESKSNGLYVRYNSCLYDLLGENLINSTITKTFYESLSNTKFQAMKDSMTTFIDILDNHRDELIAVSNLYEFEIHKQLVKNILYTHEVNGMNYAGIGAENFRDKHMADNTIWSGNFLGNQLKVAVWAHNGHVARKANYSVTGSMGNYMDFSVDENYAVVGFSFSKGKLRAVGREATQGSWIHEITSNPMDNSYQKVFNLSSFPNFILINSEVNTLNEFGEWYYEPHLCISIGAVFTGVLSYYYNTHDIAKEFDIVIHFNTTRESVSIR
nr:erythromycin esterase family protein [uncultured Sphaerochaeta sp.]